MTRPVLLRRCTLTPPSPSLLCSLFPQMRSLMEGLVREKDEGEKAAEEAKAAARDAAAKEADARRVAEQVCLAVFMAQYVVR
jgi:hypothetical protein